MIENRPLGYEVEIIDATPEGFAMALAGRGRDPQAALQGGVGSPPHAPLRAWGSPETAGVHGAANGALEDDAVVDSPLDPEAEPQPGRLMRAMPGPVLRGWARVEAWLERLAHRSPLMRKIMSRLFLPIAFHSGLTMKKVDSQTFTYVLPFRRFNRNFYDAMAGAALVANSEIAAGMYLFGELGGQWTVVCKNINYRFLRPCLGPAIYKVNPLEDVRAKMAEGLEFNIHLTLEILQQVRGLRRNLRVGRCEVVFHCAPKTPDGNRILRRRRRQRRWLGKMRG